MDPQPSYNSELDSAQTRLMLTVVYDSGMEERVHEILTAQKVCGWTQFSGGYGAGGAGLKLDTPIWPGTVDMLTIVDSPDTIDRVIHELNALKSSYIRNPGMTLWTQPVCFR